MSRPFSSVRFHGDEDDLAEIFEHFSKVALQELKATPTGPVSLSSSGLSREVSPFPLSGLTAQASTPSPTPELIASNLSSGLAVTTPRASGLVSTIPSYELEEISLDHQEIEMFLNDQDDQFFSRKFIKLLEDISKIEEEKEKNSWIEFVQENCGDKNILIKNLFLSLIETQRLTILLNSQFLDSTEIRENLLELIKQDLQKLVSDAELTERLIAIAKQFKLQFKDSELQGFDSSLLQARFGALLAPMPVFRVPEPPVLVMPIPVPVSVVLKPVPLPRIAHVKKHIVFHQQSSSNSVLIQPSSASSVTPPKAAAPSDQNESKKFKTHDGRKYLNLHGDLIKRPITQIHSSATASQLQGPIQTQKVLVPGSKQ